MGATTYIPRRDSEDHTGRCNVLSSRFPYAGGGGMAAGQAARPTMPQGSGYPVVYIIGLAGARSPQRPRGILPAHKHYLGWPMAVWMLALLLCYCRPMARVVAICRVVQSWFPALPPMAVRLAAHDRRHALFRRRAVYFAYGSLWHGIPILPRFGQPVIRLTSYHSNLNGSVSD